MIPGHPGQPSLEATWIGDGTHLALVAPPHPLMGGELSNPVVQAIGQGLAEGGLRCLLFNFRGVGDSAGNPSGDAMDADADYRVALSFARSIGPIVVAAGYSFGAATAIRIAAGEPDLAVFGVAPPAVLFPERALTSVTAPVLLLAGERDQIASAESLERVLRAAPNVRLETIPGADHFFMRHLDSVRELARRFASDLLPASS